jgi:hypothetical protein
MVELAKRGRAGGALALAGGVGVALHRASYVLLIMFKKQK